MPPMNEKLGQPNWRLFLILFLVVLIGAAIMILAYRPEGRHFPAEHDLYRKTTGCYASADRHHFWLSGDSTGRLVVGNLARDIAYRIVRPQAGKHGTLIELDGVASRGLERALLGKEKTDGDWGYSLPFAANAKPPFFLFHSSTRSTAFVRTVDGRCSNVLVTVEAMDPLEPRRLT